MSHVLVIVAHPSSSLRSRTLMMLSRFLEVYRRANPQDIVTERNVSESMPYPFNGTALSIHNKALSGKPLTGDEQRFADGRQHWVDEFVAADKYVFANPMYNLFLPAELKSYIDIVMQAHATFEYTSQGIPQGLLRGKKALHLQANGGSYHKAGSAPGSSALDLGDAYIRTILAVMGVTDYSSVFAEGMDHDPAHAAEIAESAYQRAERLAASF